jgi:hypothetical protein
VRARSAADSGWADCSVIIIENPREIPVRASFRTVRPEAERKPKWF